MVFGYRAAAARGYTVQAMPSLGRPWLHAVDESEMVSEVIVKVHQHTSTDREFGLWLSFFDAVPHTSTGGF